MFVASETARDALELARQMARGEGRAASVAWAMADEVAAARPSARANTTQRERPGEDRPQSREDNPAPPAHTPL